jgi:hypothetical protein
MAATERTLVALGPAETPTSPPPLSETHVTFQHSGNELNVSQSSSELLSDSSLFEFDNLIRFVPLSIQNRVILSPF